MHHGTVLDTDDLAAALSREADGLAGRIERRMDRSMRGRVGVADLLQEVFLVAMQKIKNHDPVGPLSLSAWLWRLAKERLIQLRRHATAAKRDVGREVSLAGPAAFEPPSPSSSVCTKVDRDLNARVVGAVLDRLDPADRQILHLRHFRGLTLAEAAREMGLPEETARKRHYRALGRLRGRLPVGLGG